MKKKNVPPLILVKPGYKLWLSLSGEGIFGRGKWQLLDAIQETGSLQAAADMLGISYRKAWGDLREAEKILDIRFLEHYRGGAEGGRSLLTEEGRRWWREYGRFQAEVEKSIARAFEKWQKRMGA